MKTDTMMTLGIAVISTLFAPGAYAGCGREIVSKLSVVTPDAHPDIEEDSRTSSTSGTSQQQAFNSGVAGLWQTSVSLDGQVIYQAYESFTSDGLEFLNDNGSPIEGNVCFGVWTAVTKSFVKVYHPAWNYDSNGNLIGTVVIKEQILLDAAAKSFLGTVVVDTYDLNGNMAAPELQAPITGKRVTIN